MARITAFLHISCQTIRFLCEPVYVRRVWVGFEVSYPECQDGHCGRIAPPEFPKKKTKFLSIRILSVTLSRLSQIAEFDKVIGQAEIIQR